MTEDQKETIVKNGIEFVHSAIQEAINGNHDMDELMTALHVLELMRLENKLENEHAD